MSFDSALPDMNRGVREGIQTSEQSSKLSIVVSNPAEGLGY